MWNQHQKTLRPLLLRVASLVSCLTLLSCDGEVTAPASVPASVARATIRATASGWHQTPVQGYGHSRWLDFVSVGTDNSTIPDSVKVDSAGALIHPDSIRVINHSDRDTVYTGTTFEYRAGSYYYYRFTFPDGYTDRFEPTQPLNLSVFLWYTDQ